MTEHIIIKDLSNITFLYGISIEENINITDNLTEYLKISGKLLKTNNFHKIIPDPFVDKPKFLYMYKNSNELINTFIEECENILIDIYYYPLFSIRYGINEKNNVIVTDKIMQYLENSKITTKCVINNIISDIYPNHYKKLYIFEYDNLINEIDEYHNCLTKNIELIDKKIVITNEFIYELYIRELKHYCSYNEAYNNYYKYGLVPYDEKIDLLNKLHINNKKYFYEIFNFKNDYQDIFKNCNLEQIYKRIIINPKIEYRYFCYRYINYMRKLYVKPIFLNKDMETVLIWKSNYPHVEFILRNTINKLPEWSHSIVCNTDNYEMVRNIVISISNNIKIVVINDIDMKSNTFWKNFKSNITLIYNEECCILKNNINDFLEYNFISSLPENINEESLSLYVKNKNNVPSTEICESFSSELTLCESFGFFRPWLTKKNWKSLLYKHVVIINDFTDYPITNNTSIYDTYIYDLCINDVINI